MLLRRRATEKKAFSGWLAMSRDGARCSLEGGVGLCAESCSELSATGSVMTLSTVSSVGIEVAYEL